MFERCTQYGAGLFVSLYGVSGVLPAYNFIKGIEN
jgi:hypothetical protein